MINYSLVEDGKLITRLFTSFSFHKGDKIDEYVVKSVEYDTLTGNTQLDVGSIPTLLDEIEVMVTDALYTDGGHHKQWYLEEILKLMDREPVADPEYSYEHGIPP